MSDTTTKQIEIECRALLTKEKHDELKVFFDQNGKDLGEDNKDTRFFLLPDRYAKSVNNTTKKTAKLVLKLNRMSMGGSDFEEVEVPINPNDFDKSVKLFSALPFDEIQNSYQERHNYLYEGVEFALKYTKSWGYHLELEIVIDNLNDKNAAEEKIHLLASKLGIKILSDEELKTLGKQIDDNYRKEKFTDGDSLHNLAENKITPQHEFMDQETLDWILKNRYRIFNPKLNWEIDFSAINDKFKKINIDPLWFEPQKRANGVHGIRHLLRVCLNSLIISQIEKLDDDNTNIVATAALIHDLRRESDKDDPDHAQRGVKWFSKNKNAVEKYSGLEISDENCNVVIDLILLHELENSKLTEDVKYNKHKKLVDILRTADALDRFIQPKLKWWPDYDYFLIKPDDRLKILAYEIAVSSEAYSLKGMESNKCVHYAFEKLI